MRTFPVELLQPRPARIHGQAGDFSIEIPMAPFLLDGEEVETSIRLDGVNLPSLELGLLQNRAFRFPSNPEAGYIDGSIYLGAAHHPVDVSLISFGTGTSRGIPMVVQAQLVLEHEGLADFANTDLTLHTQME